METFRQLTIVFTHLSYVLMALATGFVVFSMAVWLSNVSLILTVLTSGTATILEKGNLRISL